MRRAYLQADNIITPLGHTTDENFRNVMVGKSGIGMHPIYTSLENAFPASLFPPNFFDKFSTKNPFSNFERLIIASVSDAMENSGISLAEKNTLLIISTTKGNIGMLDETSSPERLTIHSSAKLIAKHFHAFNEPVIVSNACTSGILAMLTAKRFIESGFFDHVVVTGGDLAGKFIQSGFGSFQALSATACTPFDRDRSGLSLGEGAATVILSAEVAKSRVFISGGATTNDANHISGPSRTGEEMSMAIDKAIEEANITREQVGMISAHGTATTYNDEMEAKALTLSGLNQCPVHSQKAYFGHTLGAAGLIESLIAVKAMKNKILIGSKGFSNHGVSLPLNITNATSTGVSYSHLVKTASGFGGTNAAIIFSLSSTEPAQ